MFANHCITCAEATARAEAAEAECLEQARLLGMSGERELALRTELFNATAHGELKTLEALARAEAAEARNKVMVEALRDRIRVACGDWCNPETGKHDAGCENARQALGAEHGK